MWHLKAQRIGATGVFLFLPDDLALFSIISDVHMNSYSRSQIVDRLQNSLLYLSTVSILLVWKFLFLFLFFFGFFATEGLHGRAAEKQMFHTQADAESDFIKWHLNVPQFSAYTQGMNRRTEEWERNAWEILPVKWGCVKIQRMLDLNTIVFVQMYM